MIDKININKVNTKQTKAPQNQPQFTGIGDFAMAAVQACERQPMVNVTVLDMSTAIVPRTIYESQTNGYAGFEAFRRESSGLVVNCLIPSFIVLGLGWLLKRPIMGAGSSMHKCWGNEEALRAIVKYYQDAEGEGSKKISNMYKDILKDAVGYDSATKDKKLNEIKFNAIDDETKKPKFNFKKSITKLTNASQEQGKYTDKQVKKAISLITDQTLAEKEIKLVKDTTTHYEGSLSELLKAAPQVVRELQKPENANVEKFLEKSTKLVKYKSLAGLGLIIPLAISMQPINRWITAKTSGKKGAPIYKDFKDSKPKELTPGEKKKLFAHKLVSVGAMIGVALLSIMKKPDAKMWKSITQFRGIFPTMDQARLISTATFASRMMASEDENDLREATVRDIATFSAFYFLGDYVAKGIATAIQKSKPDLKLVNTLKDIDPKANVFKKFWHWAKDTSLKTSDEVYKDFGTKVTKEVFEAGRKEALRARSVCQIGNIGFSLAALGIFIPMITRSKTNKKREEELEKMGVDKKVISKYYPPFEMNSSKSKDVYQTFFTAK